MKIIKNFLPLDDYKNIKDSIFSFNFVWHFNDRTISTDPQSQPQFIHSFYSNYTFTSPFSNILESFVKKINPKSIQRIKVNLNYKTDKIIETGLHDDHDDNRFKSAIFFLNKCNGYCKIDNEKIYSEDNKLIIINSNKKHTGSTCTDKKRRIVLNMIYID
jgi:hypothetical protein|tara:strand:+ start:220 stop:699 length:480 start_codon:yes stop_codon:yes gene_type:complete